MPKRVIDFDAMWASDKLAACAEWAQGEYAWFYGLADASGSFEITNLRVIWGRVAAVRKNLTIERLTEIFEEFMARGLLFAWEQNGKRYGHWTGSDVPGRLPPPSWRMRLERLAPPVPRDQLAAYLARYATQPTVGNTVSACVLPSFGNEGGSQIAAEAVSTSVVDTSPQLALKLTFDSTQAQEWDLNLDLDWKKKGKETQVCAAPSRDIASSIEATKVPSPASGIATAANLTKAPEPLTVRRNEMVEQMFAVYEAERGPLPPADNSSVEVRRQCLRRLADGLTVEEFCAAVRRAAATPFLAGGGGRGWCASFDWFLANEDNVRKVLAGRYDPSTQGAAGWQRRGHETRALNRTAIVEARAGAGPVAASVGARVKTATLERIRAREELRFAAEKEKAS